MVPLLQTAACTHEFDDFGQWRIDFSSVESPTAALAPEAVVPVNNLVLENIVAVRAYGVKSRRCGHLRVVLGLRSWVREDAPSCHDDPRRVPGEGEFVPGRIQEVEELHEVGPNDIGLRVFLHLEDGVPVGVPVAEVFPGSEYFGNGECLGGPGVVRV